MTTRSNNTASEDFGQHSNDNGPDRPKGTGKQKAERAAGRDPTNPDPGWLAKVEAEDHADGSTSDSTGKSENSSKPGHPYLATPQGLKMRSKGNDCKTLTNFNALNRAEIAGGYYV